MRQNPTSPRVRQNLGNDVRVQEGARIPEVLGFVRRQGELPEDPAHDLPRPRLGQLRRPHHHVRLGEGTDDFANLIQEKK